MNNNSDNTPIIIDAGTGLCKAGFAGEKFPRVIFPTNLDADQKNDMVKRNKTRGRGVSCAGEPCVRSPTNKGIISKDIIKSILKRVFHDELHVDPTHHPVLFVDSPINTQELREEILRTLFTDFAIPACCLCSQPMLSLYAQGLETGVVVDSGHGSTYIAPVQEGKVIQSAVKEVSVAGRELDSSLALFLRKRGYAFNSPQEQHALREIKEKQCYVSLDPDRELKNSENRFFVEQKVELPDGEIITVQTETFSVPETLFKPPTAEPTLVGIHQALFDSIKASPSSVREDLYANIILSGGTTMFGGLGSRLSKETTKLAGPGTKIGIIEPSDRKYSAWIGGSMFATSENFQRNIITKKAYGEFGASEAISRCLGHVS